MLSNEGRTNQTCCKKFSSFNIIKYIFQIIYKLMLHLHWIDSVLSALVSEGWVASEQWICLCADLCSEQCWPLLSHHLPLGIQGRQFSLCSYLVLLWDIWLFDWSSLIIYRWSKCFKKNILYIGFKNLPSFSPACGSVLSLLAILAKNLRVRQAPVSLSQMPPLQLHVLRHSTP